MKCKIALIGEAWGEQEERERRPFVGYSGLLLNQLLDEAGIARHECLVTNVFQLRPPSNDIKNLCGEKEEALAGYPKHEKGYIHHRYRPELERLSEELLEADPNLLILFGATAMWAMLGKTKVGAFRGVTDTSSLTASGFKCLPTYHPAAITRLWSLRAITIIDLMKAKREAEFPEIRRPAREIWIEPSIPDLYEFKSRFIKAPCLLSEDIETAGSLVTCVGFAPDERHALVVPFFDARKPGRNYWPDKESERAAWDFIRDINEDRGIRKLFQNGMYDIRFLLRANGIKVVNAAEDTMLQHHSFQPEQLKGLAFLGSIYTSEGPWKRERTATIGADK
jgi:uracil-DNA glycosylase